MFPFFKKPAHAQQAGYLVYFVKAEKPLYERIPLPDERPPVFFTPIPPLHQAVSAKLIQSFTVPKHLWVRYYNNSSNIILCKGKPN